MNSVSFFIQNMYEKKFNFNSFTIILIVSIGLFFLCNLTNAQIHRANNPSSYHLKYDVNYTKQIQSSEQDENVELSTANQYLTWLFALFGITLVGLSGILPVLVLPRLADRHEDLGLKKNYF